MGLTRPPSTRLDRRIQRRVPVAALAYAAVVPARLIDAVQRGHPVITIAGARVEFVSAAVAERFLTNLPVDEPKWNSTIDFAVGAFTDGRELVGVAVLGPPTNVGIPGFVAVAPPRRGLGVGADLLRVVVGAAIRRGAQAVVLPPGPSDVSLALCRAAGVKAISRVDGGRRCVEIPIRGADTNRVS
jgi:GNAT superfamily N-acetyltransferase